MFVVVVILEICMLDIEENRNRTIAQFWYRWSLCQFWGQRRDIQRLKVFEMSGAFQTLYSLYNVLMIVMIFTLSQSLNFVKKRWCLKYFWLLLRRCVSKSLFLFSKLKEKISLLNNWRWGNGFLGVRIRRRGRRGSTTAANGATADNGTTADHHGAPAHAASRRLHFWCHFSDHCNEKMKYKWCLINDKKDSRGTNSQPWSQMIRHMQKLWSFGASSIQKEPRYNMKRY